MPDVEAGESFILKKEEVDSGMTLDVWPRPSQDHELAVSGAPGGLEKMKQCTRRLRGGRQPLCPAYLIYQSKVDSWQGKE